ncbi:hypothetical protein Tco_0719979 [Tanacetum coccineum]
MVHVMILGIIVKGLSGETKVSREEVSTVGQYGRLVPLRFMIFNLEPLSLSFNFIQRISLTGFPAQSVGSSNTDVLDLPCLLVLITGTSQSRQHGSACTSRDCRRLRNKYLRFHHEFHFYGHEHESLNLDINRNEIQLKDLIDRVFKLKVKSSTAIALDSLYLLFSLPMTSKADNTDHYRYPVDTKLDSYRISKPSYQDFVDVDSSRIFPSSFEILKSATLMFWQYYKDNA